MIIAETRDVTKRFTLRTGLRDWIMRRRIILTALRGVSVNVPDKKIIGLVGESGSGKTTLGRILGGLEPPSEGTVEFMGSALYGDHSSPTGKIQFVFQDPWAAVNPRFTLSQIVEEPLLLLGYKPSERVSLVREVLSSVGLPQDEQFLERHPWELSGGQLQRVIIARAVVSRPALIIADEPASMLDVSLRIGVLNLIMSLRDSYNTSFLFITHDLAQAMYVADYLYVLYLGEIMEEGPTESVLRQPLNPYTLSLVKSIPTIGSKKFEAIRGEVPSPIKLPSGCGFSTRCPIASTVCRTSHPELTKRGEDRKSRCLLQ